jgi:hypothetical protein
MLISDKSLTTLTFYTKLPTNIIEPSTSIQKALLSLYV